jgi:hypothetical protein
MMKSNYGIIALAMVTFLLGMTSVASAQNNIQQLSDFANPVPPLVMVLMDTSGSMEFESATGEEPICYDPRIHGNEPARFEWPKTRHVVAKEVFTGTFKDYFCQEESRSLPPSFDDDFPLKHFVPKFSRQVRETGLVFLNRDLVRFGFMGFDNDTRGGDSFSFPNPSVLPETDLLNLGARGQKAFCPPCRPRLGINDPLPEPECFKCSPLIDFGDLGSVEVGLQRAEFVEQSILNFIPFGATPLAALFRDLNTYLATDTNVVNDPFASCRGRDVIIVTDGQPTFDECARSQQRIGDNAADCAKALGSRSLASDYPYSTALQELTELKVRHGVRVHVVGFNLDPGDRRPCLGASGIEGIPGEIECVHQLAMVGGTDSNSNPDDNIAAYTASNQLELTRELTKVLNNIVNGTTARTKVTSTRRTAFRSAGSGTYQFSSAFDLNPDFHLWRGILERVESKCVGGALRVSNAVDFGKELNRRNPESRKILTTLFDRRRDSRPVADALISERSSTAIRLNNRTVENLATLSSRRDLDKEFEANVLRGVDLPSVLALLDGSAVDRRPRAEADRRVLGDIFHSNPTIVGGPELDLNIPGYQRFANAVNPSGSPRKTMVYVGSNDGMLHAFDAESDSGEEVWAYLPMELQKKVYLQKATHIFGVDGTPVVRDVRMFRGGSLPEGVVDPVPGDSLDPSNFHDVWDTVAVTGLRGGGRSYLALGVADPTEPRFMWELNPETETRRLRSEDLESVDSIPNEALIGLAYGEAAMGTVVIKDDEENLFETGVAIVPGGLPSNVSNPGKVGRAIYVVNLSTGAIIRRFTTYKNRSETPFLSAVSGSVVAHNTFQGKTITRAFVGDAGGRLLRVDLRSSDPSDWDVQIFHDSFSLNNDGRQPIFLKPSIALNAAAELVVLYGTGNIDDIENRSRGNVLFSLTERIVFDDDGLSISSFDAVENFRLNFTGAEKLTGSPIVFNSTAFFPTFVPNRQACTKGNGRIYSIDFTEVDEEGNIIGRFNADDRQFENEDEEAPDLALDNSASFFDLPDGTVVFGLEIVQTPSCSVEIPEDFEAGADFPSERSNGGSEKLSLVAQVGANANLNQLGPQSKINTLNFDLNLPPSATRATSWSAVLD